MQSENTPEFLKLNQKPTVGLLHRQEILFENENSYDTNVTTSLKQLYGRLRILTRNLKVNSSYSFNKILQNDHLHNCPKCFYKKKLLQYLQFLQN